MLTVAYRRLVIVCLIALAAIGIVQHCHPAPHPAQIVVIVHQPPRSHGSHLGIVHE